MRKTLIGAAMAASLLGLGTSVVQAQIYVQIAPPAPMHEVVPATRPGHVWVPGHYQWRDNRYVWVRGHWVAERPGYAYVAPRWVQRANGQWYLVGNYWERDRYAYEDRRDRRDRSRRFGPHGDLDRDGIPNARDRDRDGDGVPNHRDRWPDNPRRS